MNVADGEGYKRERKRKSKKTGSGSEEEPAYVEDPEDFSEDDRSRSGSPGPSTSRQERTRRTRGSPYPHPSSQFPPGPTSAGFAQMSLSELSNPNTYPRVDSPPAQLTFGQSQFYGYPAQVPRTQTHPSFPQPPSANVRPGSSRTQSAPMPGVIATSGPYGYPGGHVQSGSQQVFRGPLRESPTEQTPGYPGQAGGAAPGGYVDPRNTVSNYASQYDQGQFGSGAGMGRGSRDKGKGRDRN